MPQENSTVSLVFAANDYYAPYLSTLFASILEHGDRNRTYEFIVLSEDFENRHAKMLEQQMEGRNAQLVMLDVSSAMAPYEGKLRTWGHFKRETYFRLLLPQLLPQHHKVLYLDADMVCLHDVAELFDTNVEECLIAACKDPDTTGIYNGISIDVGQPNKRDYMDNVLKIRNPYDYFQAGVILFNLDAWRASIDVDQVFAFAQSQDWQLLDQDVLNYFCQERVRFVSMAWNVMFDNGGFRIRDIISNTTPELFEEYLAARESPRIVHYAGPIKPWHDPECDYAEHFWRFARMSPLYEVILGRMANASSNLELQRIARELEDTRAWLKAVADELQRYEQRPIVLMAKELIYQKIYTPLRQRFTRH